MIISGVLVFSLALAQETGIFLREDFNSLENWEPMNFPKIKRHTLYTIVQEGESSYLKAESNASASGIVFKREFNVFDYPKIRWRWKISNVFEKGDVKVKAGDDYPARIYILFTYDPRTASFGQKIKYGLFRKLYGEYPPHSTLNYIWANRKHEETVFVSTYADESMIIPLESGAENAGMWVEEDVKIVDDYQKVFGVDPPSTASLAIMNDSDNTGESAVSYIDYIEIYR
ncbi:MAG: hypothetical protein AMK71_01230 [Nitrospira bacterium SG8_35_4]|nr:MAG: hypothetical protein AMK71_01230 [Nitrospira bacterium SG8_35_4]